MEELFLKFMSVWRKKMGAEGDGGGAVVVGALVIEGLGAGQEADGEHIP